jgi:hypothetical protein
MWKKWKVRKHSERSLSIPFGSNTWFYIFIYTCTDNSRFPLTVNFSINLVVLKKFFCKFSSIKFHTADSRTKWINISVYFFSFFIISFIVGSISLCSMLKLCPKLIGKVMIIMLTEELDGPAVSALRRAIAEVKQHWPVIGWVTKIYYLELLCYLEGTLSCWFWLHLQSSAPTNTGPAWRVMARSPYV